MISYGGKARDKLCTTSEGRSELGQGKSVNFALGIDFRESVKFAWKVKCPDYSLMIKYS